MKCSSQILEPQACQVTRYRAVLEKQRQAQWASWLNKRSIKQKYMQMAQNAFKC